MVKVVTYLSYLSHCQIKTGQVVHTRTPTHPFSIAMKQYNLVLANEQWCSSGRTWQKVAAAHCRIFGPGKGPKVVQHFVVVAVVTIFEKCLRLS